MDDVKVYGFGEETGEIDPLSVKSPKYTWPCHGHVWFDGIMQDTVENRFKLYEDLAEFMTKHANHKVIFMRVPPEMHFSTEWNSKVNMVRLYCRFSIAEKVKDNDVS